ncbi:MAG: DnaA/Hda family protein [Paracoccaceae bacterium]
MAAEQLTFDLPVRAALGRGDYFVSSANEVAVAHIANWQEWSLGKLVLCGPGGAGKTHLSHVWAKDADAHVVHATDLAPEMVAEIVAHSPNIVVEDVDQIAGLAQQEQALFHLHNLILAEGGRLLLTALTPPSNWPIALADLKSRVLGTGLAQLGPPDDALICAVMVKLFADRQVDVTPDAIQYLAPRMERSFAALGQWVARMDTAALSQRRAITRDLAREVYNDFSRADN